MLASFGHGASLFGGLLGVFVLAFLCVLAILWFVLPFAVFGIKGRLDTLISLQRQQTDQIASLRADLLRMQADMPGE
ncbi:MULTISPECIES: hypothetical protein [Pseudoxanthomonas]|jgi:hypothetical protein|uniref:Uncharacterized protein n=1 Tax=Pseudoxanthomonas taiwanensis J19 TaxID=935569 RepID=A0A562E2L0_9GAMM|nr:MULTISPECIES: hypothetical protein [Pseudoxanthomonas]TWH16196.1 hypothetical protein L613_001300000280 [Pseudoxanthomonas taiwanensis J19]